MKSHVFNLTVSNAYTGDQLHSLFNYEYAKIKGDSIVASVGPMDVKTTHMVDMEDVVEGDFIWSPRAVNFIIEIFHIGIETSVLYQRAFMRICTEAIKKILEEQNIQGFIVDLVGDDIKVKYINDKEEDSGKKLSVSIATVSHISGLIHTGINIDVDDKIPVPAIGLSELFIGNELLMERFIYQVINDFLVFVDQIKFASVKVKGV